jgi:hypothetical protein
MDQWDRAVEAYADFVITARPGSRWFSWLCLQLCCLWLEQEGAE